MARRGVLAPSAPPLLIPTGAAAVGPCRGSKPPGGGSEGGKGAAVAEGRAGAGPGWSGLALLRRTAAQATARRGPPAPHFAFRALW